MFHFIQYTNYRLNKCCHMQSILLSLLIMASLLPQVLIAQNDVYEDLIIEADSLSMLNKYDEANFLLEQVANSNQDTIHSTANYYIAKIYARMGNVDKSIEYLSKSVLQNSSIEGGDPMWFIYDKDFEILREDNRYIKFEKRIKGKRKDYFDLIKDLSSSEENLTYREEEFLLGYNRFQVLEGKLVLNITGLQDYSLQDLLRRTNLKDLDFSNKNLLLANCDFGTGIMATSGISNLKLGELAIWTPKGNALDIYKCEIETLFYHNKYSPASTNYDLNYFTLDSSTVKKLNVDDEDLIYFTITDSKVDKVDLKIVGGDTDLESFFIINSQFGNSTDVTMFEVHSQNVIIEDNFFNSEVTFASSKFSDRIDISNNKFKKPLDISRAIFAEYNTYIPFNQLSTGLFIYDRDSIKRYDSYTGDLGNVKMFDKLLNGYQYLFNNYKQRGEQASSNLAFVAIKDLGLERMRYVYSEKGGFKNLFRYRLAQIMKLYTNHGTDPSLALLISFYIILIFAVFYFFFPSEWDTTSKSRLISNFKDFKQKNDKGYVKPFFIMLAGFALSLVNALTLSLNSFVTLGFGTIPTKGSARYVCILQGFIGWFLLSIFTVALINQVLV